MGIGAAIVGGLVQMSAANKAAKAQQAAANQDIAFQTETRDLIRGDLAPYRTGGLDAQNAYMYEMGLGDRPTNYLGYTKTPGYDFRMNEGVNAIEAGAAARGGLYSGAAMKGLQSFGQDYATSMYDQYMSRLGGLMDTGLSAAQMSGNASQNAASGVSNALAGRGNAQAAGAIGVGNAFNTGLTNALGAWQYQKNMPNAPSNNFLFGGPGLGGFV